MKAIFFGILISILVAQVITEEYEDSDEIETANVINPLEPGAGKLFSRIGSKYYCFEHTEDLNWHEALNKCRSLGTRLVSIKNETEFNAILPNLQPNKHYWIDFNDLGKEGEFYSSATGLKATYFNWHRGEPSNGGNNEHCGELWYYDNKHLMNDSRCHLKQSYICEF